MPEPEYTDFVSPEMEKYWWEENYTTPASFSTGDAGVGVSNYERAQEQEEAELLRQAESNQYYQQLQILEDMGYMDLPATSARDVALEQGPYTESQQEYLSDVPVEYKPMNDAVGMYFTNSGKVELSPGLKGSPKNTRKVAQHELDHALYYNALSPKERMDWTDKYNLAVMGGKMQPVQERDYFAANPGARAVEMYPGRPKDLPYDMYRFYQPSQLPVAQWPAKKWTSVWDPSKAR